MRILTFMFPFFRVNSSKLQASWCFLLKLFPTLMQPISLASSRCGKSCFFCLKGLYFSKQPQSTFDRNTNCAIWFITLFFFSSGTFPVWVNQNLNRFWIINLDSETTHLVKLHFLSWFSELVVETKTRGWIFSIDTFE